jgi:hypothetical protein
MGRSINKGVGGVGITGTINIVDNTIKTERRDADVVFNPDGTGVVRTDNIVTVTNTTSDSVSVDGGLGISENLNIGGSITSTGGLQGTNISGASGTFTDVTASGLTNFKNFAESSAVKTGSSGTVTHDFATEGNSYVHNSIAGNFTANFANLPTTDNRRYDFTLILNQGATPYLATGVQINGTGETIRWSGYSQPTANANKTEIQTFSVIRAGGNWLVLSGLQSNGEILDGSSANRAAPSAAYIKAQTGTNTNGTYWIDLPSVGPTQVYCLMDSGYDGGGWMLAMKATRGNTFGYTSSYWTSNNTLNPTALNLNDGDAKYETFNHFQAADMMARWPDIGQGGSFSYGGAWIWLENNFPSYISESTSTLTNLFNTASRTFIQDAKTFSGWRSGVFSSQVDVRFYGFNFYNARTDSGRTRARWGFGWNENGGGLYPNGDMNSDDVGGGIGMEFRTNQALYSAGDYISCCQDTTGINRSARVEIYVR